MKLRRATAFARTGVPRTLRSHVFAVALIAGVLLGGGLRYLPADAAADTSADQEVAGSTACAAQ